MSKRISAFVLLAVVFFLSGCRGEPRIDNVPVSEIEPSDPPVVEAPVKSEPLHGQDGVFKVSDMRYFNAVVPFGATEIGCSQEECRFFVPSMKQDDVIRFLEKYYPYQEHGFHKKVDVYEVSSKIRPEYADDAIIPTMDPNVLKPTPETAVEIRVFWNKRERRFEWTYVDPARRVRVQAQIEADEARMREEAAAQPPAPEIMPSDDSPGVMLQIRDDGEK